jgi:alkylation response protein AidB-like acyl-CoA dehydrogenase
MFHELTPEQELIRTYSVRLFEETCPLTAIRDAVEDPVGLDFEYLRAGAELGWYSLFIPEEFGGDSSSGFGIADVAMLSEMRGRALQPGPFIAVNIVSCAIAQSGTEEQKVRWLPKLASGECRAAWASADSFGEWSGEQGTHVDRVAGGFVLTGKKHFVEYANLADLLLVTAETDQGAAQFLVPVTAAGLTIRPLAGLDISRRLFEVQFERVTVNESDVLGSSEGVVTDVERQCDMGAVLTVADSIGAMSRLFESTCQYALDRTAFGRPIGSFQAIKHRLADVSLALEASKAVGVAAVNALRDGRHDSAEIASIAKAFVGDSSTDLVQECFQIHGGIAFTWEHDLHMYLRRITANNALYGSPSWHRERICTLHSGELEPS